MQLRNAAVFQWFIAEKVVDCEDAMFRDLVNPLCHPETLL
jgi:hypothetical protein